MPYASVLQLLPTHAYGEVDTATNDKFVRLTSQFALPEIETVELKSAKLGFYLEQIVGTPAGPVSLFHSVSDNNFTPTKENYEDATYLDTHLDLVNPADPVAAYFELDVTDQVLADYSADGFNAISSFRLQVSEEAFEDDGLGHGYQFTLPNNGSNAPRLILTFVPEPSTWALSIGGFLALLKAFGRRRG